MEKIRRNERMSTMLKILSDAPGKLFPLNTFCALFGAAKSTVSEDIDALRQVPGIPEKEAVMIWNFFHEEGTMEQTESPEQTQRTSAAGEQGAGENGDGSFE